MSLTADFIYSTREDCTSGIKCGMAKISGCGTRGGDGRTDSTVKVSKKRDNNESFKTGKLYKLTIDR